MSNSLVAIKVHTHPHVKDVSDERAYGDGVWAYLKPGLCWDDNGRHNVHEDSYTKVARELRFVRTCNCDVCKPEVTK